MIDVDVKKLRAELKETIGKKSKVRVKLSKRLDIAISVLETDDGISIILNPKKFKNQAELDESLSSCIDTI